MTAPAFAAPDGLPPAPCPSTSPLGIDVPCELDQDGHTQHRNNGVVWHDPPLLLIDGAEPDLERDSERWVGGEVWFSWQQPEPQC